MTRTILTLVLASSLALSLSAPVQAADTSGGDLVTIKSERGDQNTPGLFRLLFGG